MFCVKCGKEGRTYKSLCASCFLQSNRFTQLPDFLELVVCTHCSQYLLSKRWTELPSIEIAVKELVAQELLMRKDADLKNLRIDMRSSDPKSYLVHIFADIMYEDLEVTEEADSTVFLRRSVCPKCNKIYGNYFESIVQIRPTGKRFSDEEKEEVLGRAMAFVKNAAKDSNDAFIAKVTQEHNGFDLYISTNSLGKALSRDLISTYGAEYKESSSLQGQKDGHDIYRVTFLVRLPPYRLRDIVQYNGRPHLVFSMGPQSAKLRDLKSNENVGGLER